MLAWVTLLHISLQFETLSDPILAYSFKYPVQTVSGKPLRLILSHEPEKYSSAAPLTSNSRQVR